MKPAALLVLLLLYSPFSRGQEPGLINHRNGQSMLSLSPTFLLNTVSGPKLAGGIKYQYFISRRFSIDADLVFSKNYVHLSPAVIGLPLAFAYFSDFGNGERGLNSDAFFTFFLAVAAIVGSVEHLSYHIPVNPDLDISPFISFLRYKYDYYENMPVSSYRFNEQFSFATGIQLNQYYGRFVLSPYAEYNIGFKDQLSRCNLGIYFGYYFLGKTR